MRTLAVDGLRLLGPRTAMGRYIEYLVTQWSRMAAPFDRIVILCPRQERLEPAGTRTPAVLRVIGPGRPLLAWEQGVLPWAARGASVLFCPAYIRPLLWRGPSVVANHGIYESLPGEFSRWQRLRTTPLYRWSARGADRVIANSRATRADLADQFGVDPSRIDVVYPAADERFQRPQDRELLEREIARALGRRVPYVLFVGKLSRRRNVPALIEGFARARSEGRLPHHLLIVGPNTTGLALGEIAARCGVAGLVTHVTHRDQDALARLYAGADLFVLPSAREGLSWTLLEAMASGTAVLTVPHPTLAEVGAEAAHAVASPSPGDLARGLLTLLSDAELRRSLAEKGRACAARFSWQKSAEATLAILDRVARRQDER